MCEDGCKHEDTMKNLRYQGVVGSVMYLMVATRPDLAAAAIYLPIHARHTGKPSSACCGISKRHQHTD